MDLSGSVEDWDAYEKNRVDAYDKAMYAAIEAQEKVDKVSYLIHLLIAFKILGKNLIPYIRRLPFKGDKYLNKLDKYLELQKHLRSIINNLLPEGWEIRVSVTSYPGEPYFFRDAVGGNTENRVWMGKVLNAENRLNISILSGATDETHEVESHRSNDQDYIRLFSFKDHKGGTYNKKKYVRNTKRRHAKRRQSRRQNRH